MADVRIFAPGSAGRLETSELTKQIRDAKRRGDRSKFIELSRRLVEAQKRERQQATRQSRQSIETGFKQTIAAMEPRKAPPAAAALERQANELRKARDQAQKEGNLRKFQQLAKAQRQAAEELSKVTTKRESKLIIPNVKKVAASVTPGLWLKDWHKMSDAQRSANLAMDMLIIAPLLGSTARSLNKGTVLSLANRADKLAAISPADAKKVIAGRANFLRSNADGVANLGNLAKGLAPNAPQMATKAPVKPVPKRTPKKDTKKAPPKKDKKTDKKKRDKRDKRAADTEALFRDIKKFLDKKTRVKTRKAQFKKAAEAARKKRAAAAKLAADAKKAAEIKAKRDRARALAKARREAAQQKAAEAKAREAAKERARKQKETARERAAEADKAKAQAKADAARRARESETETGEKTKPNGKPKINRQPEPAGKTGTRSRPDTSTRIAPRPDSRTKTKPIPAWQTRQPDPAARPGTKPAIQEKTRLQPAESMKVQPRPKPAPSAEKLEPAKQPPPKSDGVPPRKKTVKDDPPPPKGKPPLRTRSTVTPKPKPAKKKFRLPGKDTDVRIRAGKYPDKVTFVDGFTRWFVDLSDGKSRAIRARKSGKPRQTFKVLTASSRKPDARRIPLGVVAMVISNDGVRFRRRRQGASRVFKKRK